MADPILSSLSLTKLSRQYTVFERDQVLTSDQLNSVTDYLNDQARLTRVELLGVGIVAGLQVSHVAASNRITVRKGIGITTDGDLLLLPTDTVYDRFKPYDQTAPRYNPFYVNDVMLPVHELVPEGTDDDRAKPLSAHPGPVTDAVVVMLMESYQFDPDVCSGTDCDNLGQTAIDNPRLLVILRQDIDPLLSKPTTTSEAASGLPEFHVSRPKISPTSVSSTAGLTKAYLDACNGIHGKLVAQLGTLHDLLPALTNELFRDNPTGSWTDSLTKHNDRFSSATEGLGVQYYYDFLKDVVDTWNEMREALFLDDSVLCPDLNAFPKHLLLGALKAPTQARTGFYSSPLVGDSRTHRQHARFLAQKLDTLIRHFKLTTSPTMKILVTPSRGEAASLEERAIPYYYDFEASVHRQWNFRFAKRGASTSNFGYWASKYSDQELALNPLTGQIGRYDFFRIEGHLGRKVTEVKNEIQALVNTHNLPFLVRTVLLHHDRGKLLGTPLVRYGDLHRLHYLLRNEVAMNLGDSTRFNEQFKIGVGKQFEGQPIVDTSNDKHLQVQKAINNVLPAMAKKRYADYSNDATWKATFPQVVTAATEYKRELGEFVRTDVPTPFDSVVISNHPAWLDWLDALIKKKDEQEDDKLLLGNFVGAHPGFEHCGGVARGGTFVLVYDDSGQVIHDFALPYSWPETAEEEPDQPDLKPPEFRDPRIIHSIKLRPNLDSLISSHFREKIEPSLNTKLDIQKDYFKFFRDSVGAFTDIVKPANPILDRPVRNVADELLGLTMDDIRTRTSQIEQLRNIAARPDVTEKQREASRNRIETMEADLAKSVVNATLYIADAKLDIAPGSDGGKALELIGSSAGTISSTAAKGQLQQGFLKVESSAEGSHKVAVGNLMKIVR